jgi:arabinofuranosyltransferase
MLRYGYKHKTLLTCIILIITLFELLRTAWVADDAAITLRCVLNFIHGYGPTFNIDERVQAFTHPLWFLLLSAVTFVTQHIFFSVFFCSIGCSLLTMWLLVSRVAIESRTALIGAGALLLSKAYVDFSASGLENPLAHVLIIFAVLFGLRNLNAVISRRHLIYFFLSIAGLYLTRPDLILLFFPLTLLILFIHRTQPRKLFSALLIGLLPAILWTGFSIVYYGFPFPNTAYAKLGTGIPAIEYITQGIRYLSDSFNRDPLTIVFVSIGILLGLCSSQFHRALAMGITLYLIYIISIGGDFMSGRYLTTPLLLAVILFIRTQCSNLFIYCIALIVGGLGCLNLQNTLFSPSNYSYTEVSPDAITDERGFYYQGSGLFANNTHHLQQPDWSPRKIGHSLILCGDLGFTGLSESPERHLIDSCALADPLLARLPAAFNPNWRIGHFFRQIPLGYQASIDEQNNQLRDPSTRAYYDVIRSITRGELISTSRFKNIIKMNLGLIYKPESKFYKQPILPLIHQVGNSYQYLGCDLRTIIGKKTVECALESQGNQVGFLTYGPYVSLSKGHYKFELVYEGNNSNGSNCSTWDVVFTPPLNKPIVTIAQGTLPTNQDETRHFSYEFTLGALTKNVEIRINTQKDCYLKLDKLIIKHLPEELNKK